jgi:hypothetical protein
MSRSAPDCQAALRAPEAMRTLRDEPTPIVADGAIERAVDRRWPPGCRSVTGAGLDRPGQRRCALAATVAAMAWVFCCGDGGGALVAVPEVRAALNQRAT